MSKTAKVNREKIGKKLLKLRGDNTQEAVAKALGISISALGSYERGERIPRDDVKLRIAKFYGQTVQEIFFA